MHAYKYVCVCPRVSERFLEVLIGENKPATAANIHLFSSISTISLMGSPGLIGTFEASDGGGSEGVLCSTGV